MLAVVIAALLALSPVPRHTTPAGQPADISPDPRPTPVTPDK